MTMDRYPFPDFGGSPPRPAGRVGIGFPMALEISSVIEGHMLQAFQQDFTAFRSNTSQRRREQRHVRPAVLVRGKPC
jgi:hypothetical protein